MSLRDELAFKCFRELVPYLEEKQAKELFDADKSTTAKAFKRGWDAHLDILENMSADDLYYLFDKKNQQENNV